MKQLPHIGTIELISLPDEEIKNVPAKIDTGADSSAIWASNLKVKNGTLSFNFFAPGSAYYREQPVVTTAFRTVSIKNSFGHEEFRYKIKLRIQVGDTVLLRWFSLADRSRNTYPILLGKNVLQRRFIVDVSRRNILSQGLTTPSVLVVGAKQSTDFFEMVRGFNQLKTRYDCIGYEPLLFHINGLSTCVINADSGKDLTDYGMVYFKSHNQQMEPAIAAALYLHFKGRPFFDHELQSFVSISKLSEYMKLACFDLPVPAAVCAATPQLKQCYDKLTKTVGSPFVLKDIYSNRGRNNFLVRSKKDFTSALTAAGPEQMYLAQRYIENDGFLRLYVAGKEVGLAIWRDTHKHDDPSKTHLNKPLGSVNASQQDIQSIPLEVRELAVKAASCLDRQIAGVDLIKDKQTAAWYILEVNNGPQLRSGSFVTEKAKLLAKFFDKELQR